MSLFFCRPKSYFFLLILLLSPACYVQASLMLGSTRVIFPAGDTEATVKVENPSDNDFLMQSWLEDAEGKSQDKLIVEPPVAQIKAHHKVSLRISLMDPQLKQVKTEQLFWLNVKEIPKIDENNTSSDLLLAMQTRIKVFFRPESVPEEMADAWKKLQWEYRGSELIVNNPTPYHITINKALSGAQDKLDIDMVAPFSSTVAHSKNNKSGRVSSVTYDTIGDFGDISEKISSVVR